MHSSWTVLFVGVALFLAALAQAPGRQVESAYRDWLQTQASGDVQRICEQQSERSEAAVRERYVDDCVKDWRGEITGEQIVFWQKIAQLKVVAIEVDGDYARASLRSGTCTLNAWVASFDRLDDGRWVYSRGIDSWWSDTCRERQGIPVPGDPGVAWPPVR